VSRLNLVIADADEDYVEGLAGFLMNSYSSRFKISSFTSLSCLYTFLSESHKKIEMLLIGRGLFIEPLPLHKVETVILLSEGEINAEPKDFPRVNRYQHCDRLVGSIIKIFSDTVKNDDFQMHGGRKTRNIAVYSAAGGTGKTSIAACAAVQCANNGLSAFYLNLESIQSTPLFFDCSSDRNLSHLLYNLKSGDKNSFLKIESIITVDTESKVWLFSPPENSAELEELLPGELVSLIGQLKSAGRYDVLFTDLSSIIDGRNISVLEACDDIFLVITQDEICKIRTRRMVGELEILLQKRVSIWNKTTVILNKYRNDLPLEIEDFGITDKKTVVKLPISGSMSGATGTSHFLNVSNGFNAGVRRLINKYLIESADNEV